MSKSVVNEGGTAASKRTDAAGSGSTGGSHGDVNEVRLVGRLAGLAERTLPSGDVVLSCRVVIDRPARDRGPHGRVRVDALDCAIWAPSLRRRFTSWIDGDVVEVTGVLRRRFWQTGSGAQSRIEVEVRKAKRLARAS